MLTISKGEDVARTRNITRAVSFPIPRWPPVIITTFPVWSGTPSTLHSGSGGKSCWRILSRFSDMVHEYRNEGNSEGGSSGGARAEEKHDR